MRRLRKLEIIALCLLVPPALELLPARRVFARVARVQPRGGDATRAEQLAGAVDRVLSRLPWIWKRTCLRRATVLAVLLRREGRDAEIVIGVRRDLQGALEAHAWVRCDEVEPYLEAEPDRAFSVLRHPSERPV
jgi:hypothetical protein